MGLLPLCCIGQERYNIDGSIKNSDIGKIYLTFSTGMVNEPLVKDSCKVVDGKYMFSGQIKDATFAMLQTGDINDGVAAIVLAPEHVKIVHNGKLSDMRIGGSQANEDFEKLKSIETHYRKQALSRADGYQKKALERDLNELIYKDFIHQHPNSLIGLYAFNRYITIGEEVDVARTERLFSLLADRLRWSSGGQEILKKISYAKTFNANNAIGNIAKDFSLPDTVGKMVSLSSYRGKYVLLDFWASWCSPCRADNPNLKSAYQKFNSKGFEILSVSLDVASAEKKWRKAIQDDRIGDWTHLADLKNEINTVVKLYGIRSIPQNFLINPEGKIIAINLVEGELNQELTKVFNK